MKLKTLGHESCQGRDNMLLEEVQEDDTVQLCTGVACFSTQGFPVGYKRQSRAPFLLEWRSRLGLVGPLGVETFKF